MRVSGPGWNTSAGLLSIAETETIEVQAIHIDKLLARIEGLETRLTAAGL
jgi:preprotein translocase subunit Sec61beta